VVISRLFVEFIECVDALVRRHLFDDVGGLACGQLFEHLRAEVVVEIFQDFGRSLTGQCGQERTHLFDRHRLRDVREIGWMHLLGLRTDGLRTILEQLKKIGNEQCGERPFDFFLGWRHPVPPSARAKLVTARRSKVWAEQAASG